MRVLILLLPIIWELLSLSKLMRQTFARILIGQSPIISKFLKLYAKNFNIKEKNYNWATINLHWFFSLHFSSIPHYFNAMTTAADIITRPPNLVTAEPCGAWHQKPIFFCIYVYICKYTIDIKSPSFVYSTHTLTQPNKPWMNYKKWYKWQPSRANNVAANNAVWVNIM